MILDGTGQELVKSEVFKSSVCTSEGNTRNLLRKSFIIWNIFLHYLQHLTEDILIQLFKKLICD